MIDPLKILLTGGSSIFAKIACPCIDKLDVPMTDFKAFSSNFIAHVQTDPLLTFGIEVDKAYSLITEQCIERGMTHLIVIESDMLVPKYGISKLLDKCVTGNHPFICASYTFKSGSDVGLAVTDDENGNSLRVPHPYVRRGLVQVNRVLPMGFCIIDLKVLATLPKPWFLTTSVNRRGIQEPITQDAYLSSLFISSGYKIMLDTDIQCVHVDRNTGKCYGTPEYVIGGSLNSFGLEELAIRNDLRKTLGNARTRSLLKYDSFTKDGEVLLVHGKSDLGERASIQLTKKEMEELWRISD